MTLTHTRVVHCRLLLIFLPRNECRLLGLPRSEATGGNYTGAVGLLLYAERRLHHKTTPTLN